jgi:circadian clock protein KaiC
VLVSGSPGTGKSSIGASFANAACGRGERTLLFAYEESAAQIIRNMNSIGIDLQRWIKRGLLEIHPSRPTLQGLEQHLARMHEIVTDFQPSLVIVDPISNLSLDRNEAEVKPTLMRLIDFLKQQGITGVFTSLTVGGSGIEAQEDSQIGVSSLMDVWFLLRNHEANGERNRTIFILKSRGMSHSNQIREFILDDDGISLVDVYQSEDGVLTGSARIAREISEKAAADLALQRHQRELLNLSMKKKALEAEIAFLNSEVDSGEAEIKFAMAEENLRATSTYQRKSDVAHHRGGKTEKTSKKGKP